MTPTSHDPFAACVGSDWADATPALCLQAAGTATRECWPLAHTPAAMDAWGTTRRTRCHGHPVAIGLARTQGPMVSALRTDDLLVLFPSHPLTLARYRAAFPPSRATDAPTEAARQLALRLTPRDTLQPLQPHSPTRRALAPLVAPRRRVVGDTGRITNRLTRTRKNSCPHVLPWLQEKDTALCCDFLRRWPTLTAAPRARRATLATFFRAPHGRSAEVIAQRLQAIKAALPLPTAAGVIAPQALLVQALVAQLRVPWQAIAACDAAIAPRVQHQPDFPLFQALPGAGPVCAPRRLVACGAQRERSAAAAQLQNSAGIAPVTARSGTQAWGHGRLQGPKCLRHTCVAWAAESLRHACWAQVYSQQQRDKGKAQQAAIRALAFQWIRILSRCWQERTPYEESVSLQALHHRGSSLIRHLAKAS
jgi:transposase